MRMRGTWPNSTVPNPQLSHTDELILQRQWTFRLLFMTQVIPGVMTWQTESMQASALDQTQSAFNNHTDFAACKRCQVIKLKTKNDLEIPVLLSTQQFHPIPAVQTVLVLLWDQQGQDHLAHRVCRRHLVGLSKNNLKSSVTGARKQHNSSNCTTRVTHFKAKQTAQSSAAWIEHWTAAGQNITPRARYDCIR